MNNARRKKIDKIKLQIQQICYEIEQLEEEEQAAFDNMPDSFQMSEKGEEMESGITLFQDAVSSLQEAEHMLEEAKAQP